MPIKDDIKCPIKIFLGCANGAWDALKHNIAVAPYDAIIIGAWW